MCVLQIKHLMIMKWTIKLKRVYEPAEADDGLRILVDRVWPRGIKKSDLRFDIWAKDVTPSSEARQFFHADPSGGRPDSWQRFLYSDIALWLPQSGQESCRHSQRGIVGVVAVIIFLIPYHYPGVNAISNSRAGKMKKGLCARQSFAEDSEFFTPDFPREFFVG